MNEKVKAINFISKRYYRRSHLSCGDVDKSITDKKVINHVCLFLYLCICVYVIVCVFVLACEQISRHPGTSCATSRKMNFVGYEEYSKIRIT